MPLKIAVLILVALVVIRMPPMAMGDELQRKEDDSDSNEHVEKATSRSSVESLFVDKHYIPSPCVGMTVTCVTSVVRSHAIASSAKVAAAGGRRCC